MKSSKGILPQENLYRAVHSFSASPTYEIRAVRSDGEAGDGRTLELQWSVSNVWTEIDSWFEGHFMERVAPGAAAKTIRENKSNMRILLEHGYDPQLGNKPIARLDLVEENDVGGYAEGRLFDGLDPLVVDGVREDQYGASFRFRVTRDEFDQDPGESEHNPKGIPERTIKEMQVMEFGPVTWGAYSDASAGVRSITDEMVFGTLRRMPPDRLETIAEFWRSFDKTFIAPSLDDPERRDDDDAPSEDEPVERREDEPDVEAPEVVPAVPEEAPAAKATPNGIYPFKSRGRKPSWHLS